MVIRAQRLGGHRSDSDSHLKIREEGRLMRGLEPDGGGFQRQVKESNYFLQVAGTHHRFLNIGITFKSPPFVFF